LDLGSVDQQTVLVGIYVMVADLLKAVQVAGASRPRLGACRPAGRPPSLSLAEVVTLGVFRHMVNVKDVKHYHWYLHSHYAGWFDLPNYQNFQGQLNHASGYVAMLLQWIMVYHRQQDHDGPKFIDTTPLKVCENKRISSHKVCRGLARRGKTTMGWFYGFKLGMVIDALGNLLSLAIRPGNTDDRKFLPVLFKGLKGFAIGDAGFLSKAWMEKLWEQGLFFLTDVKKTMKRLMSREQHALLKLRQQIEIRFGQIKHRLQQAVTLARSPLGYLARWLYAMLAYCLGPQLDLAA
jgi:hypothetical protein